MTEIEMMRLSGYSYKRIAEIYGGQAKEIELQLKQSLIEEQYEEVH